jgi:hypothetical protein
VPNDTVESHRPHGALDPAVRSFGLTRGPEIREAPRVEMVSSVFFFRPRFEPAPCPKITETRKRRQMDLQYSSRCQRRIICIPPSVTLPSDRCQHALYSRWSRSCGGAQPGTVRCFVFPSCRGCVRSATCDGSVTYIRLECV